MFSLYEHWLKLTGVLESFDLEYRVSNDGIIQFMPRLSPAEVLQPSQGEISNDAHRASRVGENCAWHLGM